MENDNEIEYFCHNIAFLRKSHGLSKKEMAKILGIGVWSLNKIERGELPPRLSANVLFYAYKNFGIRPSQLLSSFLDKTEHEKPG